MLHLGLALEEFLLKNGNLWPSLVRNFDDARRKYSTYDKEFYAIIRNRIGAIT